MALAHIAARGMLMVAMMLTARLLDKAAYGQLGLIQGTLMMFQVAAALGMGITATKYVAEYREKDKSKVARIVALTQTTTLITGMIVGMSVYVLAPWLSRSLLGVPELELAMQIGAANLALNVISGGYAAILAGFEAFRWIATVNAFVGVVTVPLVAGGAALDGVYGAMVGLLVVSLWNTLVSMLIVQRKLTKESIPSSSRITRAEIQLLWSFSLPAVGASLTFAPVNWAVAYLLVIYAGYGEMGLFNAANQWFSILLFLPGIFASVCLPIFAGKSQSEEAKSLAKTLGAGVLVTIGVTVPMVFLVVLLSPFIMGLYGPYYVEASQLLRVIALTAGVAATQNMLSNALAAANRMWANFGANLLWGVTNLLSAYLLLEAGQAAMALCLAALIAFTVKLVFTASVLSRTILRRASLPIQGNSRSEATQDCAVAESRN